MPATARPLGGYAALVSAYTTLAGAGALVVGRRSRQGKPVPAVRAGDIVLLGIGSFKLSRLLAKDKVTSFIRAPFVEPAGTTTAAEMAERPAGDGARKAIGELLTCPFCLDQWVATAALLSYLTAPRFTRAAAAGLAMVSVADVGQYAYRAVQRTDEQ